MKFILSRKGFDSQYGGHPSPVLPDGTMLSLPIPEVDSQMLACDSGCRYCQLNLSGFPVNECYCHLDPDIRPELYKNLPSNWCAALGQCGAAAKHLQNKDIETNDIFLFFGLFQHWSQQEGFSGKPFQAVWGYMQIDKVIDLKTYSEAIKNYSWHPHTKRCLNDDKAVHNPNLLYTAAKHLSFNTEYPGYGVFKYSSKLQLTCPGESLITHWDYKNLPWVEQCPKPSANMTYHNESNIHAGYFQAAARGQEFVIDKNKTQITLDHFQTLLILLNRKNLL